MAQATTPTWRDISLDDLRSVLQTPGASDNKYTRGVVLLATGSQTYPGAAVLSAQAAGRAGAGMIRYTGPERVGRAVLAARPEVVRGLGRCDSLVIGSGIPDIREDERQELMPKPRRSAYPAVVDAGALTFVTPGLSETVITPHAGELAALFKRLEISELSREDIEADPAHAASLAADALRCTVLLKGAATHVASADARFRVVAPTSWLSTAGTGDVLAGLLGSILAARHARGEDANLALDAAAAVWLHGRAGWLAAQRNAGAQPPHAAMCAPAEELLAGPIGAPILALDVAEAIPTVIAAVLAR
ncbi:ADP-dependent NAD(P)H-hydrate dehydratase [Gulosibacter molinativorax]|uniref:ADP-dependent (S)-NAD(P)H-hydrate dehydratase n=1 Tax=Gulosibacter molinativorax TaxID=256821 RepID=A0ABT7C3T9_9MICO|nr:ADP/ATP-dependent (S)-NAD(P)H-hydrate dehydratase [Gulosibacter molinativorax]MDJ1369910.1 NAD(P)H-hydrate dehydratase [Gulosibacter molinativorax]QUY61879.1 ADP-dependent (S)-NAD(P)H-hydrate dehydratase [Gulosibacter molinativorax]